MTDRELLELAAKAAGIEISTWSNCQAGGFLAGNTGRFWNPLTDDGDALRLAVKLGMRIHISHEQQITYVDGIPFRFPVIVNLEGDPYAATRRAIVRAAAEIGKEMK